MLPFGHAPNRWDLRINTMNVMQFFAKSRKKVATEPPKDTPNKEPQA